MILVDILQVVWYIVCKIYLWLLKNRKSMLFLQLAVFAVNKVPSDPPVNPSAAVNPVFVCQKDLCLF